MITSEGLTPEALSSSGKEAYQKGEFKEAARLFLEANNAFLAIGDKLNAAEMANNRSVALLQSGEPELAFTAVEGTDTTFAQAGDKRRQAMSLGNRGAAAEAMGKRKEALLAYQQASELFKEIGEHEHRAFLLRSISSIQLRMGRVLEAIVTMRFGLSETPNPNGFERFSLKILNFFLRRFGIG